MNSLKTIIVIITFFICQTAYSQDTINQSNKNTRHYVGVAMGFTTGNGISYRYCPKKLGGQITFLTMKNKKAKNYSLGLTLIYKLVQREKTDLFFYTSHRIQQRKVERWYMSHYYRNRTDGSTYLNNGVGIGVELNFHDTLSLNIMGGYAAYENFNHVNMTGEFCIFYKF